MGLRIHVDDGDQEAEFARLLDMGAATTALERTLTVQFAATQQRVHVDTGSLRGSGEIDSDYVAGRWSGQITYGGPSPGFVNDPVDYAVYEAARGGAHDFRRPLRPAAIGADVRGHLRGGR